MPTQAIVTQFHASTGRYSATCRYGRCYIGAGSTTTDQAHQDACAKLVARFLKDDATKHRMDPKENPWGRATAHGVLPDGRHVFVFLDP